MNLHYLFNISKDSAGNLYYRSLTISAQHVKLRNLLSPACTVIKSAVHGDS